MRIVRDIRGISRVELLCIAGIALIAFVVALSMGLNALGLLRTGDDSGTLRAAEDLAQVQQAGSCLLPGCPGGDSEEHASHTEEDGTVTVYYDKGANVLTAAKPAGYNESTTLLIGKTECPVAKNSCVVQVQRSGDRVSLSWVPVLPLSAG